MGNLSITGHCRLSSLSKLRSSRQSINVIIILYFMSHLQKVFSISLATNRGENVETGKLQE